MPSPAMKTITIGVLALQGGFREHLEALAAAIQAIHANKPSDRVHRNCEFAFDLLEVRNSQELATCDGLIIPGGQSTSISFLAKSVGILDSLRDFVKHQRKPTWGTCAGLILLAEAIGNTTEAGPELIGGLDVEICRNFFGRDSRTFRAAIPFNFLGHGANYEALFLDAPIVKTVRVGKYSNREPVEILARLPVHFRAVQPEIDMTDMDCVDGIIVAVQQGNILGTSFHPELGNDLRVHIRWIEQVISDAVSKT